MKIKLKILAAIIFLAKAINKLFLEIKNYLQSILNWNKKKEKASKFLKMSNQATTVGVQTANTKSNS